MTAFYKDSPQRKAMLALPKVVPPKNPTITELALPIDDSDDDPPAKNYRTWRGSWSVTPFRIISPNNEPMASQRTLP